jgi:hypothetical protein
MTKEMTEMLDMFVLLTDEQQKRIFTEEQIRILKTADFYRRLFNDPSFYKAVEQAVGEAVYNELRR